MPQFCKNSSILIIVIAAVLFALAATLLKGNELSILYFNLTGLYLVWLFLLWSVSVCLIGKLTLKENYRYGLCVTVCLVIFILYECCAQYIFRQEFDAIRLMRLTAISLMFLLVSLRIIQLSMIYSSRSKADLQTQLNALQAQIEPHFLFNSLNTIAELTHIDPNQAESAIQSLSSILRSNLKNDDAFHSVEEEVALCEKYSELEKWRIGERLNILFKIDPKAKSGIIPKLIIQPLVENAVRHGISPFKEGGNIEIAIRQHQKKLICSITNTIACKETIPQEHHKQLQGHGIALNNVRERLFVIYDNQYHIKASQSDKRYFVELTLPSTPPKEIALNL